MIEYFHISLNGAMITINFGVCRTRFSPVLGVSARPIRTGVTSRTDQQSETGYLFEPRAAAIDTTADEQNLTRQWRDTIPGPSVQKYKP